MKHLTILLLLSLIACTERVEIYGPCATDHRALTEIQDDRGADIIASDVGVLPVVPVYVHIMADMDMLDLADIKASVQKVNEVALPYYQLDLIEITDWTYTGPLPTLNQMRVDDRLEQDLYNTYGEYGYLNVYIMAADDYLYGYTLLPWLLADLTELKWNSIYISTEGIANHETLAHEVGHWLGLQHSRQCGNTMGNDCSRWGFTPQQMDTMVNVLYYHRYELVQ